LGALGREPRFRPAPHDLVLLTDARFVGKPNLYLARRNAFFAGDLFQARGKPHALATLSEVRSV
jgi:hypothetical protein